MALQTKKLVGVAGRELVVRVPVLVQYSSYATNHKDQVRMSVGWRVTSARRFSQLFSLVRRWYLVVLACDANKVLAAGSRSDSGWREIPHTPYRPSPPDN
jgi:hypothetical protein